MDQYNYIQFCNFFFIIFTQFINQNLEKFSFLYNFWFKFKHRVANIIYSELNLNTSTFQLT